MNTSRIILAFSQTKVRSLCKNNSLSINNILWSFQLNIQRINESVLEKAIEIALKYNFTIYDSIYIALAQIHEIELITADEGLAKAPNVKILNAV